MNACLHDMVDEIVSSSRICSSLILLFNEGYKTNELVSEKYFKI